ncbi:MAG: hypothetical protein HFI39_01340 [Lachnospiraceae bacterium]|nr:hypothetical protein [Lachnospiraceae bacterium]
MDNVEEKVMTSIRSREPLCEPFLRLSKILEVGKLPAGYLRLCSDRIADAELIDGEDVRIDFVNFPDMELTAAGVRTCRKILECYVSDDMIADAHEALTEEKAERAHINIISRTLREMNLYGLARALIKSDTRIRQFVIAEIFQRSVLIWCFRKIRNACYDILVRIKYHGLLSAVGRIAADTAAKSGK